MNSQSSQDIHCVLRMAGHADLTNIWGDVDTSDYDEDAPTSVLARVGERYLRRKHWLSEQEIQLGIEVVDLERDLDGDTAYPELISYSFEEFLVRSYFEELMKWYENVKDPLPEHVREYLTHVYTRASKDIGSDVIQSTVPQVHGES
jgi:hypothetical protein